MTPTKYTPDELRAQIAKMHPRVGYKDQPTNDEWLLQVGIGAGMLSVAADRIEALEAALTEIIAEVQDDGSLMKCGMIADKALLASTADRSAEHEKK